MHLHLHLLLLLLLLLLHHPHLRWLLLLLLLVRMAVALCLHMVRLDEPRSPRLHRVGLLHKHLLLYLLVPRLVAEERVHGHMRTQRVK